MIKHETIILLLNGNVNRKKFVHFNYLKIIIIAVFCYICFTYSESSLLVQFSYTNVLGCLL